MDREYTPTLADAIRAPTLDALVPDAALPPVGDLFERAQPELPAYVSGASCAAPQLPEWNARRPFLTGRFLYEAAVAEQQQGGAGRGEGRPAVLESYPAAVQESLRECRAAAGEGR